MIKSSKILITDDEPRICESISTFLKRSGFETSVALSVNEAIELADQTTFDLFLVDKQMPERDGFEFIDYVFKKHPETPVIMMTGNATIDSAILALKKGAYDYLKKPFKLEELANTVNNALKQKHLEDENRKISSRLTITEKKYRDMIHNSPDLIFTLDKNMCFSFVNKTFTDLFGYTHEATFGKSFLSIVATKDHEKAMWFLNDRRTEKSKRSSTGTELRIRCSPDEPSEKKFIHVELKKNHDSLNPVFSDPSQSVGPCIVARDISFRKEFEEQIIQAQKMEAIGTLAGGIAHDFNNLLMSIQGYTSLMLYGIENEHPHYKKLLSIEKHVKSGSNLTSQLLNFARGGMYNKNPENINAIVRDTVNLFYTTKKEMNIHSELEKELWTVEVDAGQIEQVLLNLFINAHFAMPGGGDMFIKTENVYLDKKRADDIDKKSGKYIKLTVRDTGCGIKKEIIKKIFDPFFTTKKRCDGTGLGLASTYGIIKKHKGSIQVKSSPGKGTTFTIYLFSSARQAEIKQKKQPEITKRHETILLIDDEKRVTDVTCDVISKIGYTVLTASSSIEGIQKYMENSENIDLVILDMVMPGLSGCETFDYIRKINPEVKVLLSSGYSQNGEIGSLLKRGCCGFLQKPYNLNQISDKINSVLKQEEKIAKVS